MVNRKSATTNIASVLNLGADEQFAVPTICYFLIIMFQLDSFKELLLKLWHLKWYNHGMKTTIDQAGRIVVPKAIRKAVGLSPGTPLEIRVVGSHIELEPAPLPVQLK